MKRAIIVVLLLVVVGAGVGAWYVRRGQPEIEANTVPITRGDIVDTVGATGTLQAVTTVQVGSQVSGNIQWLGADFNSIVKKGQVIARLDPSLFDAQLQQIQANLGQSRANLTRARSELDRTNVQLTDAKQKLARAIELSSRNLLAASELDAAKVAVDSATATVASQQASVVQAQAAVTQSEASVNQSRVNHDHTIIEAPIDGIVTQRSVDVGQTVAASMSAPTLFVIAADLTEMQVNANIDEADVGRIRPGQHVTFKVDAYPTDDFQGTVTQIRLQPVVVQNVTTYGTVITVPNTALKLKPGMTANVKIEIAKRTNAFRIPNAALRFRPTADVFAALNQTPPQEVTAFANSGRGGGRGDRSGFQRPDMTPGNASPTQAPAVTPGASRPSAPASPGSTAGRGERDPQGGRGQGGRGGFGGGGAGRGGAGGAGGGDFQGSASAREQSGELRRDLAEAASGRGGGRMLERFKTMSPDEQKQFIARMKARGVDTSAFETTAPKAPSRTPRAAAPVQAQTIDALFAPLPTIESRGRAWLFMDRQLKPVSLRLGISDGTTTELLSEELQENMEVVTGVTGLASTRATPQGGGAGNPLMPGRGGPGRGPGAGGQPGRGGR